MSLEILGHHKLLQAIKILVAVFGNIPQMIRHSDNCTLISSVTLECDT